MKTTIVRLGDLDMAGSEHYPTTYRINSCPKCYGVLYWSKQGQTSIRCENCGTVIHVQTFSSPIDYARKTIMRSPLSWKTLLLALWALVQYADHYLSLRKVLLYLFVRGLSYL